MGQNYRNIHSDCGQKDKECIRSKERKLQEDAGSHRIIYSILKERRKKREMVRAFLDIYDEDILSSSKFKMPGRGEDMTGN